MQILKTDSRLRQGVVPNISPSTTRCRRTANGLRHLFSASKEEIMGNFHNQTIDECLFERENYKNKLAAYVMRCCSNSIISLYNKNKKSFFAEFSGFYTIQRFVENLCTYSSGKCIGNKSESNQYWVYDLDPIIMKLGL